MSTMWHVMGGAERRYGRADRASSPYYGAPGSYKPSAATTGVATGVTLTPYTPANRNWSITEPGKVIENMDISGRISVSTSDVIIRNCIIRGRNATGNDALIVATNINCTNLLIEDCILAPDYPSYWQTGVLGHDFTIRRCEIYNTVDGCGLYNSSLWATIKNNAGAQYNLNVTIEACWMHDFTYYSPDPNHNDNQTHNDGVQVQGGLGAVIRGNFIDAYYSTTVGSGNQPQVQSLSNVLFNNNQGPTGSHLIEKNWFAGGMIPINCGGAPGRDLGTIWRNQFDGNSGTTTTGKPHTITMRSDQTAITGDGTADANTFYAGAYSGQEVLVRHNG